MTNAAVERVQTTTNESQQAPPDGSANAGPTAPDERIVSLDILRGVAIFGILVINIQSFSMPSPVRINPTQYGEFAGVELLIWLASHVLVEQKFIALFSIMFGAGIVLFLESKEDQPYSGYLLYYRRILVLLLIGLAHAYLLWDGDILVIYALCGLWVVFFWRAPPRRLFTLGTVLIAIPTTLTLIHAFSIGLSGTPDGWVASEAAIQAELDAYRGSWSDGFSERAEAAWNAHTTEFIAGSGWRYGGFILWGMAFYKSGLLTNDWSNRSYWTVILGGWAVGFLIVLAGVWTAFAYDWSGGAGILSWGLNNIAALFVAPAYASLVVVLCARGTGGIVQSACAAVGRTALSNYLFQTVVATTIFYGYGLGLFGHVTRVEQLAIVFGIWVLQAILSVLWLKRFEYGPVEWLWRRATYGNWS
ncbi:DUF418 domain-containing protein [Natrialbaceae archaeon AArc-T1-2]|uniref:DUF418 domain-containing protein n=1 Tax=Natrialbaceae archaeon AArc-T1-2 TaxID=3053904 RepID=UPI00255A8F1C|nr:DUF418 domain-containing protein [Natrialbaceae archaeon AArc-T1-2]WIV67224.1 DUF418 domain-containing protein [Natrialbaceae archaeon AArc-T1-2]